MKLLKLRKGIRLESLGLPFRKALAVAAELGAEGVEINARTEVRPDELSRTGVRHIQKMLSDHGLQVCCVNFQSRRGYSSLEDLEQRIDATKAAMSMAYELGCHVVSNRIGTIPSDESAEFSVLIQALEDLGRHGRHIGAMFAARTGDDEGETLLQLINNLGPGSLNVDFDPAALMINRHDVEPSMRKLGASVLHFRARDAVRDLSRSESVEVQLGRGSIDMLPLLAILEEHDYGGFLTIERPVSATSRVEMGQMLEYLSNLFG